MIFRPIRSIHSIHSIHSIRTIRTIFSVESASYSLLIYNILLVQLHIRQLKKEIWRLPLRVSGVPQKSLLITDKKKYQNKNDNDNKDKNDL